MDTKRMDRAVIKDERNRSLILQLSRNLMAYGLHPNPSELAREGTPEERACYVRKVSLRVLGVLALVAIAISIPWSRTGEFPLAETVPQYLPAGTVSGVELHETSFSTTSSVITGEGVFQVKGAVTASPGDSASFKTWSTGSVEHKSLCIDSKFKPSCYSLL
jgi:hypothetical protein